MYVVLKKKLHVKMLNLWIINMSVIMDYPLSVIVLYLNKMTLMNRLQRAIKDRYC